MVTIARCLGDALGGALAGCGCALPCLTPHQILFLFVSGVRARR